jgi:3-oxoacyl-[acyl-carrier protein] reductase
VFKLAGYIKNTMKFFYHKGYKSGGVCYKTVEMVAPSGLLKDKNIVVTGGSSGIGYAIAKECIKHGAHVVIVGRNQEKLERTREELGADIVQYDISDVAHAEEITTKIKKFFDGERIDCLVNNAGLGSKGEFPCMTEKEYDKCLNTVLKGTYFFTQSVYKEFLKVGKGNIVFIGSTAVETYYTKPYPLAKIGIHYFAKALAKEGMEHQIRSNVIAPTFTVSEISEFFNRDKNSNLYLDSVRGKSFLLPEEIANVAIWLLSDVSKCVNGQIIYCDDADILR